MTDEEVWTWLAKGDPTEMFPAWGLLDCRPPGELGSTLLAWTLARRIPLRRSIDTNLERLLEATRSLHPVHLVYQGGSRPGQFRRIHPTLVFEVAGFPGIYVSGWCRQVRWNRTFRFDRMLFR